MSEQKVFIAGYIPDEQSVKDFGARRVATAFHAKDEKHAAAKASFIFMEEYPGAQDAAYKHLLCEEAPGIPRPALNQWDEDFLYEYDWSEEAGHPVEKAKADEAQPVNFDKLSAPTKIAVLVKYRTTEITTDMLEDAVDLLDSATFEGHIVEAITKTQSIASMFPERVIEAIEYVTEKCPVTKKWPEIKAALAGWLKSHEEERKEGAINTIETDAPKPSSVAVPRPYKHTNETLDVEIASALWAGDVDPNSPQPSVTRWANGIIKEDREDFKRWSIQLRTQPDILKYDRPTIFGVVRNVPAPDTYHFPESHKQYITGYLKDHGKMEGGKDETEQNTTASVGTLESQSPKTNTVAPQHTDDEPTAGAVETTPPVDREGPFYWRNVEGTKIGRANKFSRLQEIIAEGNIEISQEEHQARKTGTFTGADVGKQLAAERGEYVEGISDPNDPKWVSEDQSAPQPEVKSHGAGRFSIEGLMGEQAVTQPQEQTSTGEIEEAAHQPAAPGLDPVSVGASLEKELADKTAEAQDNLTIWRSVMRTDPRFTKQLSGTGFDGTSINAEYMIMRATELFGPIGSRWGFEVLEDRMIPGAPLQEQIYEDKKFIGNRMLRDADGTLLFEQNHSIKIRLWYQSENDEGSVYAYGATPYLYRSKSGIRCDGEAQKKSLTDAIKKGLSLLGFSADVWLGLYDLPEYMEETRTEFAIKNASDKAEDVSRLHSELDDKMTRVASTIEKATSTNDAKKVFDTLAREVEVHRKAASAKGDEERAKYLSSRLRRLSQIKDQRIKELTESEDSNA